MTRTWPIALALAVTLSACADEPEQDEAGVGDAPELSQPQTPAQPEAAAGSATIAVAQHPQHGAYLTDGAGRALYMFTADQQHADSSACSGACLQAWPAFTAQGQPQLNGAQLDASKVGTIQRRDGQTQVTYGGWPLYYFAQDSGPGETKGQDVHGQGGEWYLVTPAGEKLSH